MRPWLEGDFDAALKLYRSYAEAQPGTARRFLVDMELERAHYRACAELLRQGSKDDPGAVMRRARLLYLNGDISDAEAAIRKVGLKQSLRVGLHLSNTLGLILLERGEFSEAAEQFQQKLNLPGKADIRIDEPETILALNGMALARVGLRELNVAAEYAGRALEISEKSWGESSIPALDSLSALGRIQTEQHDFPRARASLDRCAKARMKLYVTANPKTAEILETEAKFEMLIGNRRGALQLATQALAIRQAIASGEDPWPERKLQIRDQCCSALGYWPARTLLTLGNAYASTGDFARAAQCFDNAIPILEAQLGPNTLVVQQARARRSTFGSAPAAVNP